MLQKLLNRFDHLDALVRKGATGSPAELAEKLGLSERAWYNLRDELINDLDVPLAYDPHRRTYYCTEAGQLLFRFRRKLAPEDMEKMDGGNARQRSDFGSYGLLAYSSYIACLKTSEINFLLFPSLHP
jgi:hypothetical protein